jgi:hypothetical protein
MVIWSGLGFLVVLIAIAAVLVCQLAFDAAFGPGYYAAHKWTIGVALLLAAPACWFAGRALRARGSQTVIDKASGQEIVLDRSKHTLFFAPMHWWGVGFAVGGLALIAVDLARGS